MGIYDRDYYRSPARSQTFARVPAMSVTMWIIVICGGVFLVDQISPKSPYQLSLDDHQILIQNMTMSPVEYWFHFSADTVMRRHQYWRYLTFQFVHADFKHIL